jgi:hypothetical protein
MVIPVNVSAATTTPTAATSISVISNPPRLPADGGSYPSILVSLIDASKNPSLATTPTVVYLTSSEQNVGTVPSSVTIPAGQDYVVADFTTTLNPGVTAVTASAAGYATAQTTIVTKVPSGYANHVKVVASPGTVGAAESGSLVVQLLDAANEPAKAVSSLNISITSSASTIAQPAKGFVIVPAGADMALLNYTTTYTLGTVIFTASSSTLASGQATLQVLGPSPYSLTVSAQPNQVVEGTTGRVVVWITGTVGHPAVAPQNIAVTLTSSNLTVATLASQTVIIPKGSMSVTASFTAGSKVGSATITASAQSLQSGFATVGVFKANLKPAGLRIFFEPNPVLADSLTYNAITVGIVNATGYPDLAASQVVVNLTSATTAIGSVSGSVVIAKGAEYGTASFTSTFEVGTTIITASAQNLVSSQVAASTYGPIPAAVEVGAASGNIPANGGRYQAVSVTLVDATGSPAIAASNIFVQLTSSQPSIIAVNPTVELKAGESSLVTTVQAGISPGTANITATSPGYLPSFTLISTVLPAPSSLGLFVGPRTTINSTVGTDAVITVQLQDVNGLPAKASQPTTVTITPGNTGIFDKAVVLTVPPGGDYATASIATLGPGAVNLTASSPGLRSSSVVLTVLSSPVSVVISPSTQVLPTNETDTFTLTATALGQGVSGATVKWFATSGTISPALTNTTASGIAYGVLASTVAGASMVTAEVSSPIFGTINATTTVVFTTVVPPAKPSFGSQLGKYLIPIVVVIIVVVAAVLFLFLRMRRRGKALPEDEGGPEPESYDQLEGPAPEEGADDEAMLLRRGAPWRLAGGPS